MKRYVLSATLVCASASAQMPVPLLDNKPPINLAHWQAAAPIIQAALECRRQPDPNDPALRRLFPKKKDEGDFPHWEFSPPQGFTVFGLPVHSIDLDFDPGGDYALETYTANIAATKPMVAKAAKLNNKGYRKAKIGDLYIGQSQRPSLVELNCVIVEVHE